MAKLLLQHCANILKVAIDLKNNSDPSSKADLELCRLMRSDAYLELGTTTMEYRTTGVKLSEAAAATDAPRIYQPDGP